MTKRPRSYRELCAEVASTKDGAEVAGAKDGARAAGGQDLAELYHENSKLNATLDGPFAEGVTDFSEDILTLADAARSSRHYPGHEQISLPRDFPAHGPPVFAVLRRRRTCRQLADRAVSLDDVARLLWFAAGETGSIAHPSDPEIRQSLRAAPSAGGLNSTELYLAARNVEGLAPGVYHYHPASHALALLNEHGEELLSELLLLPGMESPPLILIITGTMSRLRTKYGPRGYRFLMLDAGHLAQNLLLAAEGLRLAAVPLGGFHDDALDRCLELTNDDERSLYPILVGHRGD